MPSSFRMWLTFLALLLISCFHLSFAFSDIGNTIDAAKACLSSQRFSQVSLVTDDRSESDDNLIDLIEHSQKNQFFGRLDSICLNSSDLSHGLPRTLFLFTDLNVLNKALLHLKDDYLYKNSLLLTMAFQEDPNAFLRRISESFPRLSFTVNSRLFVASWATNKSFVLFEVNNRITPASNVTISRLCNADQSGKNTTEVKNFWKSRKDLKGVTLRVGVMLSHAFTSLDNKVKIILQLKVQK